jgi:ParB family transcriptional regulator, chromosome partitioning protein
MEQFKEIPIGLLRKSPTNPRRRRDPKKFEDLCASVKEKGIIQPIVVRRVAGETAGGVTIPEHFEIAVGEGRYLAAEKAGLETLPAMVRELSDLEVLEIQIIENAQREDIHPLDEGEGYKKLMEMDRYDVATIAAKVGKSESWVYQRMKLTDLIEPVKQAFIGDALTAGHAILLARLQAKDQEEALKECFRGYYLEGFNGKASEKKIAVSVRELEAWIHENIHLDLHSAPWKKDDATLYPDAGACTNCQKRTGFMPALFPDIAKRDTCTDPACFKKKQTLFIERKKSELIEPGKEGTSLAATMPALISTGYNKPEKKDVLKRGGYTLIHNKSDRCQFTKKAIVAEGEGEVGQVKEVCVSLECSRHQAHRPASSAKDPAYEAKMKREREKREAQKVLHVRILDATLAKVPKVLGTEDLRDIALYCYAYGYGGQDVVDRRHGWKPGYTSDTERKKRIASIKPKDLQAFLIEFVLTGFIEDEKIDQLLAVAKRYKVNVQAIEKRWAKEQAEKAAAEKKAAAEARKKKAQTSAKVAGSIHPNSEAAQIAHALHSGEGRDKVQVHPDGTASKIYDEPTCIGCGCTHTSPCPGGCAWAVLERIGTNRGLCTACKHKGVKFTRAKPSRKEEKTMAAKKAKKAKKNAASKKKPAAAAATA